MAANPTKTKGKKEKAEISVDTQLFKELGELLVGRDATALLELVKNSYDADARIVTVDGQNLDSKRKGVITVGDDGNGMTPAQFRKGFLRLAGRGKTSGDRRSPRYGRRYTGEKGVGRLAAHKLARVIDIDSVPRSQSPSRRAVTAHIDWAVLERRRTLAKAGKAIEQRSYRPGERPSGTEIKLTQLRHAWSDPELTEFVSNVAAFSPPPDLIDPHDLHKQIRPARPLFRQPKMRDRAGDEHDPGFRVNLTGEFGFAGEFWDELVRSVEWVLEISATPTGVRFSVAPTKREIDYTDGLAAKQTFKVAHPDPRLGPFFQARILARNRTGSKDFRNWSANVAGVRVYSEGFRVLPYGAPDNDWLRINRDYVGRARKLQEENEKLAAELNWSEEDEDLALTLLPGDSYVGAVFLTRERSGGLEMLVNREGFVANDAFTNLTNLLRLGISILTRTRAAARLPKREAAKAAREARRYGEADEGAADDDSAADTWQDEAGAALEGTRTEVAHLRTDLAAGNTTQLESRVERLEEQTERLATALSALIAEQRLVPILASVGIQMGEFIHEINGLLSMTATIDSVLGRLRADRDAVATPAARRDLAEAQQTVGDLRARLERQASYLIDLTAPTAVRRRSRQCLAERLDRAAELVRPALDRRAIKLVNRVPVEIRTPAMFPAELTAVLLNLLTNAIKAAGDDGRIRATARQRADGALSFRIDNSGDAVDLDADPERWFRPFETTTTDVDPLLGQGMGFGLPISRDILDEYGAEISFARPHKGYATAVKVDFPA